MPTDCPPDPTPVLAAGFNVCAAPVAVTGRGETCAVPLFVEVCGGITIDTIDIQELDVTATGLARLPRCTATCEPIDLLVLADENHIAGQGTATDNGTMQLQIVAWVDSAGVINTTPHPALVDCRTCVIPEVDGQYTTPSTVCVDSLGVQTSWLVRDLHTFDNTTGVPTFIHTEYSVNGTVWSTTVPTGTVTVGACTPSTSQRYSHQIVDLATPYTSTAIVTSVAVVRVDNGTGSLTVTVGGVPVAYPVGLSGQWGDQQNSPLPAGHITITATGTAAAYITFTTT